MHDTQTRFCITFILILEKLIKKLTKKVNTVNVFYLAPTIFGGNWVLSKARAKFCSRLRCWRDNKLSKRKQAAFTMYITRHWKNIITKFAYKNNLGKTDGFFFSGISNICKKKNAWYNVQTLFTKRNKLAPSISLIT